MPITTDSLVAYIDNNKEPLRTEVCWNIYFNRCHYFKRAKRSIMPDNDVVFMHAYLAQHYAQAYLYEPELTQAVAEFIVENKLVSSIEILETSKGKMALTAILSRIITDQAMADLDLIFFDNDHWLRDRAISGIDELNPSDFDENRI